MLVRFREIVQESLLNQKKKWRKIQFKNFLYYNRSIFIETVKHIQIQEEKLEIFHCKILLVNLWLI